MNKKTTVPTVVESGKGVVETASFDLTKITASQESIVAFSLSSYTTKEMVLVLKHLLDGASLSNNDIAELLGQNRYWIGKFFILTNLEPSLLDAIDQEEKAGLLPMGPAFMLGKMPHSVQLEIWNVVKNKRPIWVMQTHIEKLIREYKIAHPEFCEPKIRKNEVPAKSDKEEKLKIVRPPKPVKEKKPKYVKPPKPEPPPPTINMDLVKKAAERFGLVSQKAKPTSSLKTVGMPADEPDPSTFGTGFGADDFKVRGSYSFPQN